MDFFLSAIRASNPKEYVATKLKNWVTPALSATDEVDIPRLSQSIVSALQGKALSVPYTSPDQFPALSAVDSKAINEGEQCALKQLAERAPLLPGESVESDVFSYLAQPFAGAAAGTALLHRRTNYADLYYVFTDTRVDQTRLVYVEPAAEPENIAALSQGGDFVTDIAKDIATSLLKWAGLSLIGEIFPDKPPSYFNEVYAEIRKIVHEELTANTISEINGAINGIAAWSKYDYADMKKHGTAPDVLLGLLRDQSMRFHENIQTLMLDRYACPGLQVFLVAGGLHLALYQEMAIVRTHGKPVQSLSQSADTPAGLVEAYAKHAEATYQKIVEARSNVVKVIYDPLVTDYPPVVKDRWYWIDQLVNKRSGYYETYIDKKKKTHPGEPRAKEARTKYLNGVIAELAKALGDPTGTAKKWREADKPKQAIAGQNAQVLE